MSNMYTSTLDNTLQSEMSRNTNRQARLPPCLHRKLLESLIIANQELKVQNWSNLKSIFIASINDVFEDQWRDANQEYDKKEESLLTAAIFQAQSPQLDEILDMIIYRRLSKEQAKETVLIWVNKEYQSAREDAKIMISNAVREGEEMIQEANNAKVSIINSANENASGIIESAKTESMKIIDEAKRNANQIIDDALKKSSIEKKKRDEMITKLTEKIDRLKQQTEQIMQEKESIKKEKDEIFVEAIKLARNSNLEQYHLSATTQQENRRNQSSSEREWNSKYRAFEMNKNEE